MVVAHQGENAAMPRGAVEIGVAERIAAPVYAGAFSVPDSEDAVIAPLATNLGLLRAPDGCGREIFVEARREDDLARLQMFLCAPELQVEAAERRPAIAADEACGVQSGAAVALLLHEHEANDRLRPGKEHAILCEVVLVVERHPAAGHFSSRRRVKSDASDAGYLVFRRRKSYPDLPGRRKKSTDF